MVTLKKGKAYDNGSAITHVHAFLETVNDAQEAADARFYFRGDGDSLVPHVGKKWCYGDRGPIALDSDDEWQLLHRFRRFANPDVSADAASWETLFLARHHELPTRLLDWSTNPLVALYFALGIRPDSREPELPTKRETETQRTNQYVWAIELRSAEERADIDVLAPDSDPLAKEIGNIPLVRANRSRDQMAQGDAIKIIFPTYNSARITAQRGVFTWQSDPTTPLQSYAEKQPLKDFPDNNLDIARVWRWPIANDIKTRTEVMQEVNRAGIDARAISPDLDGICRSLLNAVLLFSKLERPA